MLSQGIVLPSETTAEPAVKPETSPMPKTEVAPVTGQAEVPAPAVTETIADISEVVERFGGQDPMAAAFLGDCECAITTDGKKIFVKTVASIGAQMLAQEKTKAAVLAAFRMCGYGQAGTELVISSGAAPKEKKNPLDDLTEF